jgi:hypothetical protein
MGTINFITFYICKAFSNEKWAVIYNRAASRLSVRICNAWVVPDTVMTRIDMSIQKNRGTPSDGFGKLF